MCVLVLLSIFQREKGTNNTKICKVKRAKSSRKNTRTRFSEGCLHIFPPFFIPRLCCCHPPTACPRPLTAAHSPLPPDPAGAAFAPVAFTFMAHKTWQGGDDGHKFKKKKKNNKNGRKTKKNIYIKPRFFRQKRGEKNFCNEMAQEIRRNVGGPSPKNTQYIFAHLRGEGVREWESGEFQVDGQVITMTELRRTVGDAQLQWAVVKRTCIKSFKLYNV